MENTKILFLSIAVTAVMLSTVMAAGDESRGKLLFNDPKFAHAARACSECHPDGRGLADAADKKVFHIAGGTQSSLEEAVNTCIVEAAGGEAIDPKSADMEDILAYIRSLKQHNPAGSH